MCLIITVLAAVTATLVWCLKLNAPKTHMGTLALMYWGASLMWTVDGAFSAMKGESFFDISLNDAVLGAVVVFCGLTVWTVMLLCSDSKNVAVSLSHKTDRR